jgi:hypothetical protein
VLGYLKPGSSSHEGSHRRDIEGVRTITTSATGIHYRLSNGYRHGLSPHRFSQTSNFINRFSLEPECSDKGTKLGWSDLALHYLFHNRGCLIYC